MRRIIPLAPLSLKKTINDLPDSKPKTEHCKFVSLIMLDETEVLLQQQPYRNCHQFSE